MSEHSVISLYWTNCSIVREHAVMLSPVAVVVKRSLGLATGVTVKNIPTREIIPPVYFRIRKSVKNIPGGMFLCQAIHNG